MISWPDEHDALHRTKTDTENRSVPLIGAYEYAVVITPPLKEIAQ